MSETRKSGVKKKGKSGAKNLISRLPSSNVSREPRATGGADWPARDSEPIRGRCARKEEPALGGNGERDPPSTRCKRDSLNSR